MYLKVLVIADSNGHLFVRSAAQCDAFCKQGKCGAKEYWVPSYSQRKYFRGNGKLEPAKTIKGHCKKKPPHFDKWNGKLKDGKPNNWYSSSEEPSPWTTEERERVLSALGETPEVLKDPDISGIYRLKQSAARGNPASNNYVDFVLYDNAFDPEFNLTHILDHELSHRLFEDLPEERKQSFRQAAGWRQDTDGTFRAGRPKNQFVRPNGMLSPTEDFADDVTEFFSPAQ